MNTNLQNHRCERQNPAKTDEFSQLIAKLSRNAVSPREWPQRTQQLAMQIGGCCRHKVRVPKIEFTPITGGHNSARLANEQHACGYVPRLNVSRPKSIQRPARNLGKV